MYDADTPQDVVLGEFNYLICLLYTSVLPHAGQIYQYSGARALFMGGEINFNMDFLRHFNYRLVGEYVYTCLLYTSLRICICAVIMLKVFV